MLENSASRYITGTKPRSRRVAKNRKRLAAAGAACAYVGLGFTTFHVVSALTGDGELAGFVVLCSSLPLSALLFFALDWIESHL